MIFIEPSLEKVFNTLVNNDEIINFLKQDGALITKASLYDNYTPEKVKEMEFSIYTENVNTLYELAQVLLNFSDKIKNNQIWYLLSNRIAWKEIANSLCIDPEDMTPELYKQIIYTYKYCVVSSFFQNNKDKFIPENDFYEMEKNPAAKAFYDAMMKEFDKLDVMVNKCLEYTDYDKIPYDMINYLTQLLGWEKSDMNADEDTEFQFRELAKNILDIYRVKGTNYSFELFFNFLGFSITVKEFYFDRRLYNTNNTAGNSETEEDNNCNYEYYLTVNNPADNKLKDIGISEIVSSNDFTKQYSMHEFNVLCNEYGPEAVLGYSPIYPVYNSNGDLVEYKEYTGKVYKYFKTNVIYYTIKLDRRNPTEKQLTAVTKYLDFLTPSYVMRHIKVDTYSEKTEEPLGFDGDGTGSPDAYGNYGQFTILDGEGWSQHFKSEYTKGSGSLLKVVNENKYDGKEETYKIYSNSNGQNDFRLPLEHRTIAKSVNRYLTGGTGTNYPQARRLKYYILRTLNGEISENWGDQNVVIAPYFTIPPFVGNANYISMQNKWDHSTKIVNLTGGDGNGGEECVKTQIRDAELRTPVNYVTDKTISEFIKEEQFNELTYGLTFSKVLTNVRTINYGSGKYKNAYEAYLWELNQNKMHLCNISCEINAFEKEIVNVNDLSYSREVNNKALFENDIYSDDDIKEYYKNGILKELNFGDYVLTYTGTLSKGSLKVYRYGYNPYPIKGDDAQYRATYLNYLNSFSYVLQKDHRGKLSDFENVNLSVNYASKNTLEEAQDYVNELRESMISKATTGDVENWNELDFITNKLFYIAEKKDYYRAVKVTELSGIAGNKYDSGKSHIFSTINEALEYFENNPNEKVNNCEFYISSGNDKGLYTFKYKNRIKGCLIYSTKDEAMYYVYGSSSKDIKRIDNFFGNLVFTSYTEDDNGDYYEGDDGLMHVFEPHRVLTGNTYSGDREHNNKQRYSISENGEILKAEINKYDYYWKGYDELADEEDFVFYNSPHRITWNELNIDNKYISRPVKYETDKDFDYDTDNCLTEYKQGDDINKYKLQSGVLTYYNTFGQRIVSEISEKTISNFVSKEHIDWYEEKNHARGILSIIENNVRKITGKPETNSFEYYSKASDFFEDYYRIIILGNYNKLSIPQKILEDAIGNYSNITNGSITEEFKNKIKTNFNNAIKEIAEELDDISKSRVYYHKIGNWRDMISGNIYTWRDNGNIKYRDDNGIEKEYTYDEIYANPFINNCGPKKDYLINGQYYYSEKTNFLNIIKAAQTSLMNKFGDNINFSVDEDLLGKDAYSLAGKHQNIKNYTYNYKAQNKIKTISFDDNVNISYDSIYNYYVVYSLKYGLKNYSKDFYGEQRDIYSEFTELFDLFNDFANGVSGAYDNINNFLKIYYYKKLTSLYREAGIEDNSAVSIESYGKKPMLLYPKLAETFNGKAGTYGFPDTLLSSYNSTDNSNLKLKFFKFDVKFDNNYKEVSLNFYVHKNDFKKCYGYDFNRYYKNLDLNKISNIELRKLMDKAIEEMYTKQFSCIKPHFFYYKDIYNGSLKLTNWQKARSKYEIDFSSANIDLVDENLKSITLENGRVIDANGGLLFDNEQIKNRLNEASIIIITVKDSEITPTLKLNLENSFFKDMENEEENIYGFLTVKKITQTYSENYISKSYSNDWINKTTEGEPTEYTSFGDDRSFTIKSVNKLVRKDNYDDYFKSVTTEKKHDEEVAQFDKYNRVLTDKGYTDFKKEKTFEDQGIKPVYKTVKDDVVFADADKNKYLISTFETDDGQIVSINDTALSIYYNSDGNIAIKVPSNKITSGDFKKIKVFFKLLYVKIKTIYDRAAANLSKPIIFYGDNIFGNFKSTNESKYKFYILSVIKKIINDTVGLVKIKNSYTGNNILFTHNFKSIFEHTLYKGDFIFANFVRSIPKIKNVLNVGNIISKKAISSIANFKNKLSYLSNSSDASLFEKAKIPESKALHGFNFIYNFKSLVNSVVGKIFISYKTDGFEKYIVTYFITHIKMLKVETPLQGFLNVITKETPNIFYPYAHYFGDPSDEEIGVFGASAFEMVLIINNIVINRTIKTVFDIVDCMYESVKPIVNSISSKEKEIVDCTYESVKPATNNVSSLRETAANAYNFTASVAKNVSSKEKTVANYTIAFVNCNSNINGKISMDKIDVTVDVLSDETE